VLLLQQLLPTDLERVHHRRTQDDRLLERETPAFISPNLWLPNSRYPSSTDYKIWAMKQHSAYQKKLQDIHCEAKKTAPFLFSQ